MSRTWQDYGRSFHGDLGVGKRPDELTKPDRSSELVGTTEAAQILGMQPKSVGKLIRTGGLPARLIGGRYYVTRGAIEQRLAAR